MNTLKFTLNDAVDSFDRLYTLWGQPTGKKNKKGIAIINYERTFWHSAYVLQSAICFFDAVHKKDPKTAATIAPKVKQMVTEGYAYYEGQITNLDYWWDDVAWWGITLLDAYELRDALQLGDAAEKYLSGAITCQAFVEKAWNKGGLETIYDEKDKKEKKIDVTKYSPVSGGCWNFFYTQGGVQNTVVNGLYLILSTHLHKVKVDLEQSKVALSSNVESLLQEIKAADPLKNAYDIFKWFYSWIHLDNDKFCGLSNNFAGKQMWLVRDTAFPLSKKLGRYIYVGPNELRFITVLEQGLLIAGLAELLEFSDTIKIQFSDSSFHKEAVTLLNNVSRSSQQLLFDSNDVLQEAPFTFLYSALPDMALGKGAFMRYVSSANEKIKALSGLSFDKNFESSANAVWANAAKDLQFTPNWFASQSDRYEFVQNFQKAWLLKDTSSAQTNPCAPDPSILLKCSGSKADPDCSSCEYKTPFHSTTQEYTDFLTQGMGLDAFTASISSS